MSQTPTPVIVLSGYENALSVARNLSRQNIPVFAVNYPTAPIRVSRYAHYIPLPGAESPAAWKKFLLGEESEYLRGAVVLACGDEAISIIAENQLALSKKFMLEETEPILRGELVSKWHIYEHARAADIPTVGYWCVNSLTELEQRMSEFRFPMVLKPIYSPHSRVLKSKASFIPDGATLIRQWNEATRLGVRVILMDYIPGGDDKLCSYHSYIDQNGDPLVHLTKRQPRRYPRNSGCQTYAFITWIPEAAELGLKFLRRVGFVGLSHIEFKWDERDKRLKLIEVNPRFSGSDGLITKSGINLALMSYNRITGRPQKAVLEYRQGLVLCRPIEDALAALELRKRGELKIGEWIAQLLRTDKFPFFEMKDPMPAAFTLSRRAWQAAGLMLSAATRVRWRSEARA